MSPTTKAVLVVAIVVVLGFGAWRFGPELLARFKAPTTTPGPAGGSSLSRGGLTGTQLGSGALARISAELLPRLRAAAERTAVADGYRGGTSRPRLRYTECAGFAGNLAGLDPAIFEIETPYARYSDGGRRTIDRDRPYRLSELPCLVFLVDGDETIWLASTAAGFETWGFGTTTLAEAMNREWHATGQTAVTSAYLWSLNAPRLVLRDGRWDFAGVGREQLDAGIYNSDLATRAANEVYQRASTWAPEHLNDWPEAREPLA